MLTLRNLGTAWISHCINSWGRTDAHALIGFSRAGSIRGVTMRLSGQGPETHQKHALLPLWPLCSAFNVACIGVTGVNHCSLSFMCFCPAKPLSA